MERKRPHRIAGSCGIGETPIAASPLEVRLPGLTVRSRRAPRAMSRYGGTGLTSHVQPGVMRSSVQADPFRAGSTILSVVTFLGT